jgi:hypothetical protein
MHTLVHSGADGDVYRLRQTLPRAFVTCSWTPATEASATALLGGAHTVVFRYRPASVRDGLALSVVAWLAIAGLGGWAVVRARRASGTAAARGRPASSAG